MKYFFLHSVLLLTTLVLRSQTPATNLQKYWFYRDRFLHAFTYVGDGPGESLAGDQRWWNYNEGHEQYELRFDQDQCIQLAWYMSVLATEYRLLKDNNLDCGQTKKELYYAIEAFNRLDIKAESYYRSGPWPSQYPLADLNGFFMRTDIEERAGYYFWGNHSAELASVPEYSKITVAEATDVMYSKTIPDWFISRFEVCENSNEMSKDQVFHIIMGLAFIKKCVDPDDYYDDGNGPKEFMDQQTIYFVQEAKNIAERLMAVCAGSSWCSDEDYDDHPNGNKWCINNPVTNRAAAGSNTCCCGPGANAGTGPLKYGIAAAISYITEEPILNYINTDLEEGFYEWQLSSAILLGATLDDISGTIEQGWPWSIAEDAPWWEYFKVILLSSVGHSLYQAPLYLWNNTADQVCAGSALPAPIDCPIYNLVHSYLHDESATGGCFDQEYYSTLLGLAPCEGPWNFTSSTDPNLGGLAGSYGSFEWSAQNRFIHPERRGDQATAEYSGLDYMLLYNLYCLWYGFPESHIIGSYNPLVYSDYFEYYNALNYVEKYDYPRTDHVEYPVGGISYDESIGTNEYPKVVSAFHTITSDKIVGPGANLTYNYGDANGFIAIIPPFDVNDEAFFEAVQNPLTCNTTSNQYEKHAPPSYNNFIPHSSMLEETISVTILNPLKLSVHPNPASNYITIETGGNKEYAMKISDLYGKPVASFVFQGASYELDVSRFIKGLYYIQATQTDNQATGNVKLIIQ